MVSDKNMTKEMLQALTAAQHKLDAVKKAKEEPIAIIGMGCRFPGAKNLNVFWELLNNGVDAISEVPKNRWDIDAYYDENPDADGKMYTRSGGFLEGVDLFDAGFFDISPKEAKMLDPQQRLLLEVAVEALEHANQPLETLIRSATGVFVGISSFDYAYRIQKSHIKIDANLGTGTLASPAAGRISYFLGAQGPSMVIDTACSSSLVAIHQAITSLRNQEINLALVGGVSVIAAPNLTVAFSRARMLSLDSRCKTFDASANGYVRSEGCGVVVLKRLSDAQKNGDNILAVIKGSAVNQDGASGGLTIPNGPQQEAVIRQALKNANVQTQEIGYVEAHGTGTSLGDPIEVNALGHIFTERETPLLMGSVKTNIGHAEAAAGMASLIKVVLALQQEKIPANLHFKQPNPHIPWHNLAVKVADQPTTWSRTTKQRIAGISAFGFSGTNAHIVVAEAPPVNAPVKNSDTHSVYLLTISAKTPAALDAQVEQYLQYVITHTDVTVMDICLTSNLRRTHFKERLAFIVSSLEDIKKQLSAYQAKNTLTNLSQEKNDWHKQLERIANAYVSGEKIIWEDHYGHQTYNNIVLPLYPWQKTSYWIDIMQKESASLIASAHPFLQKQWRSSTIATGQIVFESSISIDDMPYLREHRLYDKAIFLGAGYIEMALAAAVELLHKNQYHYHTPLVIQELLIKQTLILSEEHVASLVQLILTPNDCGYDFKVMSLTHDQTWMEHIQGQLVSASDIKITETQFDLAILKNKIQYSIDVAEYYQLFSSIGVDYGPAFQVLNQVWRDPVSGDVLGLIDLPEVVTGAEHYYCHPLVLDGCFQLLAAALHIKNNDEKIYYLLSLESLIVTQRPRKKMWCYIRSAHNKEAGLLASFDLYLLDETGTIAAEMLNLKTHRADRKALLSQATNQWYYEILWQSRALALKNNALIDSLNHSNHWLILSDRSGFGEKLATFLQTHHQHCVMVFEEQKDFQQLITKSQEYQHIIYLWGIDHHFNAETTTLTTSIDLTADLLLLVQALVKANQKQSPRLSVVTRHAQAIATTTQEIEQSALWGFGRVLVLEHPELKPLFIDVDTALMPERLLEEILLSEREQQVVLRGADRYVARLRHALLAEKKSSTIIHPEASYLITGGLGGLGLQMAHYLVELGARHLLLMSRQGASTPEAQAEIKRLENKGVTVKVIKFDIAQAEKIAELRSQLDNTLRGVIHTAGVLDDGMIIDQSAQRFASVMAPKIQGTWNLHQVTQHLSLDFFVCFSSMTSVIGAMGQASYAVANAFMDAFCQFRHQQGLAALSISWGPWDSPGMANNQALKNHWNKIGMSVIAPEQGIDIFGRLLKSHVSHMGVIAMDWTKYPDDSSFFEYLKPAAMTQVSEKNSLADEIKTAQGEQRKKLLIRYIESQICNILGYDAGQSFSVTQGFFELGISSLTSVEFRNNVQHDLDCRLPSTLIFDYPTIKKLVDYLITDVLDGESPPIKEPENIVAVNNQTPEEIAEALAKELGLSWE
ncbi:MAG: SDR family NAD(P)-dependent oxidoreductase [Pseudomonadota bacterium]